MKTIESSSLEVVPTDTTEWELLWSDIISDTKDRSSRLLVENNNTKWTLGELLLTWENNTRKIVTLSIFNWPSSEVWGFAFVWVVLEFINFLEKNMDHPMSVLFKNIIQEFLWDDYDKLLKLLIDYSLSWKCSIKELLEKTEFNWVLNKLSSQINFAKLSYISWIMSNLYYKLAMEFIIKNKEKILKSKWDRFLINWENLKRLFFLYKCNIYNILREEIGYRDIVGDRNTSWVFITDTKPDEWTFKCEFNPT